MTSSPLLIAQRGDTVCEILPRLANRHGLVTGATGTGKTITLQTMAEQFSHLGVPVFMADVKGDLSGMALPGQPGERLQKVLRERGLPLPVPQACPVTLWDVFGDQGHPVRATLSDLGPLLLARMLDLNETQSGVLNLVFKVADDQGLALLDLKDLRAMLAHVAENASDYTARYGNVSAASVGAIQRGLLQLEAQGGDRFFGEPMLDIADLMQTLGGQGVIQILAADRLMTAPRLYASFLLWLLSELFETLPEVGDLDQPKLVFFFDEAHLLFKDAPKVLVERIELVVRLVRSKGVGVYFVTQNPLDIPETILGQLGHRVQHALRAFTPRDQKAVATAASTMRPNPALNLEQAITELEVGEALVSFLDAQGRPGVTQRAFVVPPASFIGPLSPEQRQACLRSSLVAGVYENAIDRDSAFERLQQRVQSPGLAGPAAGPSPAGEPPSEGGLLGSLSDALLGRTGPRGGREAGLLEMATRSAVRSVGSAIGREIVRGVLGSLLGGRTGRRR